MNISFIPSRKLRAAEGVNLVRMNFQPKTERTRSFQNSSALLNRKHARFAEHIAILREIFFYHAG